ncbi:zinc finger [Seminavis robusta]|uniref:Palmitoyltransferase n=1 Tax=Seminavis robusta TaxID=568900 RepID=A0A9N8DSZ3_9STRA|nr:zinc finger [Seminavis robusta]|eukprot:Sro229_g093000.1 zinc finger (394) ;mRNA; r:37783-39067
MAFTVGVGILLALYVLMMGSTFYFCMVADPALSPTARFVSYDLPNEIMKLVGKVAGPKGQKLLEVFMDRLMAIVYLTVVIGGFLTLWLHAYPWAQQSSHVPNYHLNIGYVVFLFALYTWRLTMTTSPGIITNETLQYYDHFPYDDFLYVKGRMDKKRGIPRLARSKFDRMKHQQHVARFDHYCGWVAGTIGEENYRLFLLFVATQFGMCVYGTMVLTRLFMGEIEDSNLYEVTFLDKSTGQEYKANNYVVFQYLFHRHIWEAAILTIMAVMAIALSCFLLYHFYVTSIGMTTNEHYKWSDVRKWHKEQVKKYNAYVKKQQETTANDNSQPEKSPSNGDTPTNHASDEVMEDPGPIPKNIYNRGFVENWKQVLFPISLQRKAEALKQANKSKNA